MLRVSCSSSTSTQNVYDAVSLAPYGSIVQVIADQDRFWQSFEMVAYNSTGDRISNSIGVVIRCPYAFFFAFPASSGSNVALPGRPDCYLECGRTAL